VVLGGIVTVASHPCRVLNTTVAGVEARVLLIFTSMNTLGSNLAVSGFRTLMNFVPVWVTYTTVWNTGEPQYPYL
jgi:hypothetical protein